MCLVVVGGYLFGYLLLFQKRCYYYKNKFSIQLFQRFIVIKSNSFFIVESLHNGSSHVSDTTHRISIGCWTR